MHICVNTADKGDLYISVDMYREGCFLRVLFVIYSCTVVVYTNMGGGLMQAVAYGAQDVYLTGNPQITFFKAVYRRHTNFSRVH
jgi:hypothetical protein